MITSGYATIVGGLLTKGYSVALTHTGCEDLLLTLSTAKSLAVTCQYTEDDSVCPTACIADGYKLILNMRFLCSLEKPEQLYILLHEALHVRFYHMRRFMNKHQEVANIACDLAINGGYLSKWDKIKIVPNAKWNFDCLIRAPKDGCFPGEPPFENMPGAQTAEKYYADLMKKVEEEMKKNPPPPPPPGRPSKNPPPGNPPQKPGGGGDGPVHQQNQPPGNPPQNPGSDEPGIRTQGGEPPQVPSRKKIDGTDGGDDGPTKEDIKKILKEIGMKPTKTNGQFKTETDNPSVNENGQEEAKKITKKAVKDAEETVKHLESAGKPVKITSESLRDFLDAAKKGGDSEEAAAAEEDKEIKLTISEAGLAGVDAVVKTSGSDDIWEEILDPLKEMILGKKTAYMSDEDDVFAISQAISKSIGDQVFLRGRLNKKNNKGELLVFLDCSGSMGDDWMIGLAKCADILFSGQFKQVTIRVCLFSDHLNPNEEFILYTSEGIEENELDRKSIIFDAQDVPTQNIVDLYGISDGAVRIGDIIKTQIGWGGGTSLKPVVDQIQITIGSTIGERFPVTVVMTDGDLYNEPSWVRSPAMDEVFGQHLNWLFFVRYGGVNFSEFVGENKFMIKP